MKFKDRLFYTSVSKKIKQYETLQKAADSIPMERSLLSKYGKGKAAPSVKYFGIICKWLDQPMESFFK